MTSFVISHPTEGVNNSDLRLPFAKSYDIEDVEECDIEGFADSRLAIEIDQKNYKLSFIPGTHDEFTRLAVYNSVAKAKVKSLNSVKRKIDEKLKAFLAEDIDDENPDAEALVDANFKAANDEYELLLKEPLKYHQLMAERDKSNTKNDDDNDQTIEKADDSSQEVAPSRLPGAPVPGCTADPAPTNDSGAAALNDASTTSSKKVAAVSTLKQEATGDVDSAVSEEESEVKGNDTITNDSAEHVDRNASTNDAGLATLPKPYDSVDKDGETKMS